MLNWIDLLVIVVILVAALQSQRLGFVNEVLNLAGLVVSLIGALFFYSSMALFITRFFDMPKVLVNPIAFLGTWIIIETLFFALIQIFGKRYMVLLARQSFNKYLGFIPGVLNGLLFASFALLFLVSLPLSPQFKKDIFDSKVGSPLVAYASEIEKPFNNIFGPIAKQSLTFLTVNPEEQGSVELGYNQTKLEIDMTGEQEILRLVNEERAKMGIDALEWDESRAEVGRGHSKDMFTRGYFSHYSPEGKDVGDRLEEAGISFTVAGENLALAPSIARAHQGLMNSPGHKRNILDPAFKRVGIGVVDGGVYGKMLTQVFTN